MVSNTPADVGINKDAYNNTKQVKTQKAYANQDLQGSQDGRIDKNEAQQARGSIFQESTYSSCSSGIKQETRQNSKFQTIMKNLFTQMTSNYTGSTYTVNEVEEADLSSAQSKATAAVKQDLASVESKLQAAYKSAIEEAANGFVDSSSDVAANQQEVKYSSAKGAADKDDTTTTSDKYNEAKKGLTEAKDENGDQQYKVKHKKVNGTEQEIFVDKSSGKAYILDDNGQKHELVKTGKKFMQDTTYTTKDDLQNAGYDVGENGKLADKNLKLKSRKVDGKYQTVVIDKGADKTAKKSGGDRTATVIEHSDKSGHTFTSNVTMTDSKGINEYHSSSSGTQDAIDANANDDVKLTHNGSKTRLKTGEGSYTDEKGQEVKYDINANNSRKRTDVSAGAQNHNIATDPTIAAIKSSKAGTVTTSGDKTTVTLGGQKYEFTTIDPDKMSKSEQREATKNNDATMRELTANYQHHQKQNPGKVDMSGVFSKIDINADDRKDANHITDGGSGKADGYDAKTNTNYGSSNKADGTRQQGTAGSPAKNNTINYGKGLQSASQFQSEGWARSSDGSREKGIINEMQQFAVDSNAAAHNADGSLKTGSKLYNSVKGQKTAQSFTELYVNSHFKGKAANIDVGKLADAIQTANPSFFDESGNMYQNADFNRINFPSDKAVLSKYAKK